MFEILELVEEHLCGHSVVPFDSGYLWRGPPGHLPQVRHRTRVAPWRADLLEHHLPGLVLRVTALPSLPMPQDGDAKKGGQPIRLQLVSFPASVVTDTMTEIRYLPLHPPGPRRILWPKELSAQ